jgi:hypothetical protein
MKLRRIGWLAGVMILCAMTGKAENRYFVGTGNWNTTDRWSLTTGGGTGASVPGANDNAIFDGSSGDCTINAAANVLGMLLDAGYGSTVTQSGTYTINVGTNHYTQNNGTFVGGSGAFTIASKGKFIQTAGSFTAPSAMLSVGLQISITGGTYIHNNGTVRLWNLPQSAFSFLDASGVTFYNLILQGYGNSSAQYVTNSCTVLNELTNMNSDKTWTAPVEARGSGSSITLLGRFFKTNSISAFSVPLVFTNGADQTLGIYDGGSLASDLTINKTTGTVSIIGPGSVSAGFIKLTGGNLVDLTANLTRGLVVLSNAVTYIVSNSAAPNYYGNFTVYSNAIFRYATNGYLTVGSTSPHTLMITNGAEFTMTTGTLKVLFLQNYGTLNMGAADFVFLDGQPSYGSALRTGGTVFNNFTYDCYGNRELSMLDDWTIRGNLTTRCVNPAYYGYVTPSGTRRVFLGGSFTQTNCVSIFGNANLTLEMTGTNRTITMASGYFNANLAVTNGASVSLTRAYTNGNAVRVYSDSTLNLAGANLTAGSLTVSGTLRMQGGEPISPATPTLNAGSTVRYDGAASPVTVKAWSYRNLSLQAPGKQLNWTAGTTYSVAEGFIANGGILRSTTPTAYWYLNLGGSSTQNVQNVDVQDSDASGGKTVRAFKSIDSGRTLNWLFPMGGTFIQVR